MIYLCGFGVSNYYNKLKLLMLEKGIEFQEKLIYPWESDRLKQFSPLGKIPYIETPHGGLSESQAILEYLEDCYPEPPLYPADTYSRAKCRELIQHLELNSEWVARRLYKEAFFGGAVSEETKHEARERLALGLGAVAQLASFSPYVFGPSFTAADCVAYVHFVMIKQATETIFGEDMLARHVPNAAAYVQLMDSRPHVQTVMADRASAMHAFIKTGVKYNG
ncbi:MAG: glutathione S-transferase [Caulobacteraceae bacterium]